jgi:hypothetical protein
VSWVNVSMSMPRRVEVRRRLDREEVKLEWVLRARSSRLGRRDVALA